MKKIITLILISIFILNIAIAQTKIGYVDTDAVAQIMKETRTADSLLLLFRAELEADLVQKNAAVDKLSEAFVRDSAKMNVATKAAKRAAMQSKAYEVGATSKKYDELLQVESQKLKKPVIDKLFAAIETVAKENNYPIVLYSTIGVPLNNGNDLTDKVKKKLEL
jgi:Skp family chaperone for outer membrane proteins